MQADFTSPLASPIVRTWEGASMTKMGGPAKYPSFFCQDNSDTAQPDWGPAMTDDWNGGSTNGLLSPYSPYSPCVPLTKKEGRASQSLFSVFALSLAAYILIGFTALFGEPHEPFPMLAMRRFCKGRDARLIACISAVVKATAPMVYRNRRRRSRRVGAIHEQIFHVARRCRNRNCANMLA